MILPFSVAMFVMGLRPVRPYSPKGHRRTRIAVGGIPFFSTCRPLRSTLRRHYAASTLIRGDPTASPGAAPLSVVARPVLDFSPGVGPVSLPALPLWRPHPDTNREGKAKGACRSSWRPTNCCFGEHLALSRLPTAGAQADHQSRGFAVIRGRLTSRPRGTRDHRKNKNGVTAATLVSRMRAQNLSVDSRPRFGQKTRRWRLLFFNSEGRRSLSLA